MNEKEPKPEDFFSIEEASNIIGGITGEVALMGANDSEIPDLNKLRGDLKEGKISPQEAVQKARAIQARKMDYH